MICQNKCDSLIGILGAPEELPKFDIDKFLIENLKYPETAKKDKIEGVVLVRFWVDENGITSEHTIIKGIREDLNEEVLRIAKLIKFDKPAMNRGGPVGMCFQFPVSFSLLGKEEKKAL